MRKIVRNTINDADSSIDSMLRKASSMMIGDTSFDFINSFFNVAESVSSYPPHNIICHDNEGANKKFTIQLATAGYSREQLSVSLDNNKLIITGEASKEDGSDIQYRGIAARQFTKSFILHEHIVVQDVKYVDGILSIRLEEVIPESEKVKTIPIQ